MNSARVGLYNKLYTLISGQQRWYWIRNRRDKKTNVTFMWGEKIMTAKIRKIFIFGVLAYCVTWKIKFHPVEFSSLFPIAKLSLGKETSPAARLTYCYSEPVFCGAISFGFDVSDIEYRRWCYKLKHSFFRL